MVDLRNYDAGDENSILSLIETILSEYSLTIDPKETDSDILDIQRSYIFSNGAFKVLVDNRMIIGSYGLFRIDMTTCELRKMYLNSKYRGKGYGKRMMDDALITAKSLGYSRMILETNLKEAVFLYKKYGFKVFKPDHLSARCDIAMEKNLIHTGYKNK